jgi:hypothetical protein
MIPSIFIDIMLILVVALSTFSIGYILGYNIREESEDSDLPPIREEDAHGDTAGDKRRALIASVEGGAK